MLPSLPDILRYYNENVIFRYEKDYSTGKLKGTEAFYELLKYMWLSCKHTQDLNKNPNDINLHFSCTVHEEMKDIDNMWHTFLLFTQDYYAFCQQYLGVFFHHVPATSQSNLSKEEYETELSRYLVYIDANLGEETLVKWFDE